jgi:hypothetical protein
MSDPRKGMADALAQRRTTGQATGQGLLDIARYLFPGRDSPESAWGQMKANSARLRMDPMAGLTAGATMANPVAMALTTGNIKPMGPVGFKAYHGSPHDFDKFSLSKIGTGEGAQAYGHGLYFAEKEGVAKSYRDALAKADGSAVRPDDVAIAKYGAQWDDLVQKIRAADYKDPALRAEQDALHQQMVDD